MEKVNTSGPLNATNVLKEESTVDIEVSACVAEVAAVVVSRARERMVEAQGQRRRRRHARFRFSSSRSAAPRISSTVCHGNCVLRTGGREHGGHLSHRGLHVRHLPRRDGLRWPETAATQDPTTHALMTWIDGVLIDG